MNNRNTYTPQTVTHPGDTLAEKLEELGMDSKEFALRTGKPEKTISQVLNGKSSITPEMAVRFETVLGIPAHFWLQRQSNYDEALARTREYERLAEAVEWAKNFPVAAMASLGWVGKRTKWEEKTEELLCFFGLTDADAWGNYYLAQDLKVQFRISLKHSNAPHALSAWLRHGELQAQQVQSPPFSKDKFREALPELKAIMAAHPQDYFARMKAVARNAGVTVVHTPCLPKAPINGATRWLGDRPVIQLSGRYRRNDIFWFTFFHEAGHILLHGKKDIFLEKVEYEGKDAEKEAEADAFASKWLLTQEQLDEVLQYPTLTEELIIAKAQKFGTHPAIIIGRLQHDNLLPHGIGNQFMQPIELN
jgi:addiction module HigA family antidote